MLNRLLKRIAFSTTQLDQYYYQSPNKVGAIFATSKIQWTQNNIKTQSESFARGLISQKFIAGDTFLVRLPLGYQQYKIAIRIAVSNLGGKVIVSKANNMQQLKKQINQTNARAFIFNSYDKLGDTTVIDSLYYLIPEMIQAPNDKQILPRDFLFLRYLIQVDNYPYRGTFNYSKFIKYGLLTDYTMSFTSKQKVINIDGSLTQNRPLIITDPCHDLAFRAGVLNCLINGNLLICISPQQSKIASEKFQHKVDFICTEPMKQLHTENRVFVQAGSKLYLNHPKRIQLNL